MCISFHVVIFVSILFLFQVCLCANFLSSVDISMVEFVPPSDLVPF